MRILGISGSLRRDSHNTRLLGGVRGLLPEGPFSTAPLSEVIGEHTSGAWPRLPRLKLTACDYGTGRRVVIAGADAVLVATPEYNASIPGVLKNALDWVSRPVRAEAPLMGKPAAVIGASTSLFGAIWAQAETRKVLSTIGARVVDRELPLPQAEEALGRDDLPVDSDARELLEATLAELIELAERQRVAA